MTRYSDSVTVAVLAATLSAAFNTPAFAQQTDQSSNSAIHKSCPAWDPDCDQKVMMSKLGNVGRMVDTSVCSTFDTICMELQLGYVARTLDSMDIYCSSSEECDEWTVGFNRLHPLIGKLLTKEQNGWSFDAKAAVKTLYYTRSKQSCAENDNEEDDPCDQFELNEWLNTPSWIPSASCSVVDATCNPKWRPVIQNPKVFFDCEGDDDDCDQQVPVEMFKLKANDGEMVLSPDIQLFPTRSVTR